MFELVDKVVEKAVYQQEYHRFVQWNAIIMKINGQGVCYYIDKEL